MKKNSGKIINLPEGVGLFRLDGRVALVTGGGGHLGRFMAEALAEAGAHVILNGRSAESLQSLARSLQSKNFKVSVIQGDISQELDLKRLIDEVAEKYTRLDILVNNAYNGRTGTMETAELEDFQRASQLGVAVPFRIMQLALPLLEKAADGNAGGASVINIASMYGMVSPDPSIYGNSGANNPPFYGAAKAGLIQLTRYAACHWAAKRIRVNCLSPGPFPLPEIEDANPDFYEALCRKNPMQRIGYGEELKGPLLFLASDASSYVTGVNLPVDGGWTAW
jgi:NAD(P)-dependent dehydrogenase (short-subunit alcohol dehydrogenase family)